MPPEGDNFSQSDSTAYFEDMMLGSEDNSTDEGIVSPSWFSWSLVDLRVIVDDDSEPILGQWFEETLVPPDPVESKSNSTSENVDSKSNSQLNRGHSVVPEKGEVRLFYWLLYQLK